MKKRVINEAGFTLIELVTVIAIMGIITATLIPQFTLMTTRSRMTTDVNSVKILQNQIEAYYADTNKSPGSTEKDIVSTLVSEQYLNTRYVDMTQSKIFLETANASISFDSTASYLKLSVTSEQYKIFRDSQLKSMWLTSS